MSDLEKKLLLPALCLAILTLTVPGMALAQAPRDDRGLDKAIRSIEQRTGGRVLSAEKRRVNNQPRYRVKVLTPSGRVKIIYLDSK